MKTTVLIIALVFSTVVAMASEEQLLGWTSAVVQCGNTPEAGDVSCDIKIGGDRWEKFVIQAFGTVHTLAASDLEKLKQFPLSSLRTSHEAGYDQLGGHTVHFRFNRNFYNPDKKLLTQIIYVSVTKKGVTVSDRRFIDPPGESTPPAADLVPTRLPGPMIGIEDAVRIAKELARRQNVSLDDSYIDSTRLEQNRSGDRRKFWIVTWRRNEYVNDVPIKGGQTYVHIYMDGTGKILHGE